MKFRRSLYFVKDMRPGEVITPEYVRSVRPGSGLAPKYLKDILGKRVSVAVDKNTSVKIGVIDSASE